MNQLNKYPSPCDPLPQQRQNCLDTIDEQTKLIAILMEQIEQLGQKLRPIRYSSSSGKRDAEKNPEFSSYLNNLMMKSNEQLKECIHEIQIITQDVEL